MTLYKCYKKPSLKAWRGRIDDPKDPLSWRLHQIIEPINLLKDQGPVKKGFALLGYACDEGVRRNLGRTGAKLGPAAIRRAMASLPVPNSKNFTLYDTGDIICRGKKLELSQSALKDAIFNLLQKGVFPIVLGGSHDLSYGHFAGLLAGSRAKLFEKPINHIGIINFDAHFDLRPHSDGSHSGSPFLQIANDLNKQSLSFQYLVLGIQNASNTGALFETANQLGAHFVTAEETNLQPLEDIKGLVQRFIDQTDAIYLTFCLDALPASVAPGVSAPNPYGLNPQRSLSLFKHIVTSGKVIGFDVAEMSPPYDIDNHTAKFAAYLIFELLSTIKCNQL